MSIHCNYVHMWTCCLQVRLYIHCTYVHMYSHNHFIDGFRCNSRGYGGGLDCWAIHYICVCV